MDRRDFQQLSRIRATESRALLKLELSDGAYYLAGYAVECALKACIAKGTRKYEFPDKKKAERSYRHKLDELVKVASLEEARTEHARNTPEFRTNWHVVQSWSEESRYSRHRLDAARELVSAVSDRRHGAIAWIRLYW